MVLAGEEAGCWALFSHPQPAELTKRGKCALCFFKVLCFRCHVFVLVFYSSLLVKFDAELDKCPVK